MERYTFGLFERFIAMALLLALWGMVATVSVVVVAEHRPSAEGYAQTIQNAHYFMFLSISILCLARPVTAILIDAYPRVKKVVA